MRSAECGTLRTPNSQLATQMNPWSALTIADVLNQFNDSETLAYDTAKGDANSASLPDIIGKVMDQVVGAYANAGRLIDLSTGLAPAGGTIPAEEKNRAIAVARWKYLLAIPTGKSLAENRADDAKAAETYWLALAKREIKGPGGVTIARPGRHIHTHSFDGMGQT